MAKALEPPQAVQPGSVLHASYNVTALAELEGSPYLLSADGKGALSCWDVSPGAATEPVLFLQAHRDAISEVLLLKSSRIPEQLEASIWSGEQTDEGPEIQESKTGEATPKTPAASNPKAPQASASTLAQKKSRQGGCCKHWCCRCCRSKNIQAKYWILATSAEDGCLAIWLWRTSDRESPLDVLQVREWTAKAPISGFLELHDGILALSFKSSCDVRLLDPATATVLWALYGHTARITAFAECSDGRLASGGADGVLRIWEKRTWALEDGKEPPTLDLHGAADATGDVAAPPVLGTEAWAAEKPGVCSMAFHAHNQKARRAESAALFLRVLVHNARGLPKTDHKSVYVACSVLDVGASEETTGKTSSSRTGSWKESFGLTFRRTSIAGRQELPECSYLDIEVVLTGKKERTIARCSVLLEEVLQSLQKTKVTPPAARKLYSPQGQAFSEELTAAELVVGFSLLTEERLMVKVESVQGMPIRLTQPMFVRASIRQSCARAVKSLPSKIRDVTSACYEPLTPTWAEVLEFEIPIFIGDWHVSYSPDLRLHFQVIGRSRLGSEKLVAELFLPLDAAMVEGQVKAFQLKSVVQAPRKSGEAEATPLLRLSFQSVVPCPKQLECSIDSCSKIRTEGVIKNNLQVRMQFVEGDPMVSAQACRTTWKQQTIKPVWKQRCVLDIPPELSSPSGRTLSVRKGWVHENRSPNADLVVCIDVYDRDVVTGKDRFMCRGHLPFFTAWEASHGRSGFSASQFVELKPSNEGKVSVSFGRTDKEQLIVNVLSAEKLPGRESSGLCDAYCVVRLARLGQMGQPTDQASVHLPVFPTAPGWQDEEQLVFEHKEVLDLPGALQEGMVAARPNWHLKFDLVDMKKQVVLCSSSVSVMEVLDSICATEGKDPITDFSIRERLEEHRSLLQSNPTVDPFADEQRLQPISRKLVLTQLDKPYTKALEQGQIESQPDLKPKKTQVGEAIGSAMVTLGLRDDMERKHLGTDGAELQVRFKVLSRWKGLARGDKRPLATDTTAPSAVRCLATLSSSIVAGYEDGNVVVWDVSGQSCGPLHQFQAHKVPVSAIAVLPPLGCVVTVGEVRNGLEAFSESLLRLWSTVTLELRQSVSLHGQVARCLRPLVLGASIEEIMKAAAAAGKSAEKRDKVVPPCLAVGTDSRSAKQVRLMRVNLDWKK